MDLWFEISHKTFEIFFERKLELYHGEVSLLDLPEEEEEEKGMEGEEQDDEGEAGKRKKKTKVSALLTEPLKPMPTSFLDSADEATITRYHKLPSGFDVSTDESIKQEDEDENSSLYGELTPEGVRQMCNYFFFSAPSHQGGEKEQIQKCHFVDLGSGTGKVCYDLVLLLGGAKPKPKQCSPDMPIYPQGAASTSTTPIQLISSVGIEYDAGRHSVAETALQQWITDLTEKENSADLEDTRPYSSSLQKRLQFFQGSFLDQVLLDAVAPRTVQGGFTHFFCCGVGFDLQMVTKICDMVYHRYVAAAGGGDSDAASASFEAALFLFKEVPKNHPLLTSTQEERGLGLEVTQVKVHTTWLNEAPGWLIRKKAVN